jgi:hypothetical protein
MKKTHLANLLIASATISVALADNVYKVIDENGTVAYSDRPISGVTEELMDVNISRTNLQAVAGGQKEQAAMAAAVQTRENHEAEDAADAAGRQAALAEQRAAQCEKAKQRSEKYNTHRKLYTMGEDGEREYLSDEELDAARADAALAAEELCS